MGPLARAVPKAMLPLVDSRDRLRPIVHFIVDEALSAGIEQVALILSPDRIEMVQQYFEAVQAAGQADLKGRITYIPQMSPRGFGDAVACGAAFVGDEPFVVLLGDHVYVESPGQPSCATQLVAAFAAHPGAAMVGVQSVGLETIHLVGVAAGLPLGGQVYRCSDLVEKPDPPTARERLTTPGLPADRFLAHFGIYLFGPEMFECLARLAEKNQSGGEIALSDAQTMLLSRHPDDYFLIEIDGRAYDTGTPAGYVSAQEAIRKAH